MYICISIYNMYIYISIWTYSKQPALCDIAKIKKSQIFVLFEKQRSLI